MLQRVLTFPGVPWNTFPFMCFLKWREGRYVSGDQSFRYLQVTTGSLDSVAIVNSCIFTYIFHAKSITCRHITTNNSSHHVMMIKIRYDIKRLVDGHMCTTERKLQAFPCAIAAPSAYAKSEKRKPSGFSAFCRTRQLEADVMRVKTSFSLWLQQCQPYNLGFGWLIRHHNVACHPAHFLTPELLFYYVILK